MRKRRIEKALRGDVNEAKSARKVAEKYRSAPQWIVALMAGR